MMIELAEIFYFDIIMIEVIYIFYFDQMKIEIIDMFYFDLMTIEIIDIFYFRESVQLTLFLEKRCTQVRLMSR